MGKVIGQRWEVYEYDKVKLEILKKGEKVVVKGTPDYRDAVIRLISPDGIKTIAALYETWKSATETPYATKTALTAHTDRKDNPHSVTKAQAGLGNVPNVDTTNAGNISSGTLAEARLPSLATTAGNASTGATQLAAGTNPIKTILQRLIDNITKVFSDLTAATTRITTIEGKIPNQATNANQLADKNFVNSSINAMAAHQLTYNAAGDPFPTKASLTSATTFYYKGAAFTPTEHDYCIVTTDESQSNAQVRYVYNGAQWIFSYKINDKPFTAAQTAAIDSGATKAIIDNVTDASSLVKGTLPAERIADNSIADAKITGLSSSKLTGNITIAADTTVADIGTAAITDTIPGIFQRIRRGLNWLKNQLTAKANDADVVKLTGNQTVAGVKTFSSVPVLPSSNPTSDNQAVRKAYVDTQITNINTNGISAANINIAADTTVADIGTAAITDTIPGIFQRIRRGLNWLKNQLTDVVKLSGNQTISGTKTFATSPPVPSKNTAAGNNPTVIATEAQVNNKIRYQVTTCNIGEMIVYYLASGSVTFTGTYTGTAPNKVIKETINPQFTVDTSVYNGVTTYSSMVIILLRVS